MTWREKNGLAVPEPQAETLGSSRLLLHGMIFDSDRLTFMLLAEEFGHKKKEQGNFMNIFGISSKV